MKRAGKTHFASCDKNWNKQNSKLWLKPVLKSLFLSKKTWSWCWKFVQLCCFEQEKRSKSTFKNSSIWFLHATGRSTSQKNGHLTLSFLRTEVEDKGSYYHTPGPHPGAIINKKNNLTAGTVNRQLSLNSLLQLVCLRHLFVYFVTRARNVC